MNQYHASHHAMHHHTRGAQQQQQTEYYSGQWTKEEQEYVACLMDGFKNGTLDIPDGTSLRFFIAAKLGCKPKRVSKKYERSGYNGKQVYRRDTNVPTKELEAYRQRLKDCEKAFKDSRALVVSMQEAKTTDGNRGSSSSTSSGIVTETPVISLRSAPTGGLTTANAATQAALEDRLLAMRSQIDRRTTSMLNPTVAGFGSSMGATAGSSSLGGMNNTDMLQAMMFQQHQQQRQRAQQQAAALGLGGVAPTNKLLIDLYQRRQQLIMSRAAAAQSAASTYNGGAIMNSHEAAMMMNLRGMGGGSVSPTLDTTAAAAATPSFNFAAGMIGNGIVPDQYNKRDLEDLEAAEEQARKRARAA